MQGVDHAHGHQSAGARVLLTGNVANLEAQLAEGTLGDDLMLVALNVWVGDDADFGSVEANACQSDGGGDVDALGKAQRALEQNL
jgi:hypothetical protein